MGAARTASFVLSLAGRVVKRQMDATPRVYEVSRPDDAARVDVVFIHGICGNQRLTWTHDDGGFWPDWLQEDLEGTRVLSVDYPTAIDSTLSDKPDLSIEQVARQLLLAMAQAGVGDRPTVFVCHSMGGLILKRVLWQASLSRDHVSLRSVWENLRGVIFFATPHNGSSVPSYLAAMGDVLKRHGSAQLMGMRWDSEELESWHTQFLADLRARETPVGIFVFYEKKPTYGVQVVEKTSATYGFELSIDKQYEIPVDHSNVCKWSDRTNIYYGLTIDILRRWTKSVTNTTPYRTGRQLDQSMPVSATPVEHEREVPPREPQPPAGTRRPVLVVALTAILLAVLVGLGALYRSWPEESPAPEAPAPKAVPVADPCDTEDLQKRKLIPWSSPKAEPAGFEFYARARLHSGCEVTVSEGGTLKAGEEAWFELHIDTPAWVYLAERPGKGPLGLLFPNDAYADDHSKLGAGEHRIPPENRVYRVDGLDPGESSVLLVVSKKPLGAAAPDLQKALRAATAPGSIPQQNQVLAGLKPRGLVEERRGARVVTPDKHGVALHWFTYQSEP